MVNVNELSSNEVDTLLDEANDRMSEIENKREELQEDVDSVKEDMDSYQVDQSAVEGDYYLSLGTVDVAGVTYDCGNIMQKIDINRYNLGLSDYTNAINKEDMQEYKDYMTTLEHQEWLLEQFTERTNLEYNNLTALRKELTEKQVEFYNEDWKPLF